MKFFLLDLKSFPDYTIIKITLCSNQKAKKRVEILKIVTHISKTGARGTIFARLLNTWYKKMCHFLLSRSLVPCC